MASRSKDPVRTRERILTLATAEFARKGYDGARVEAIARRCRLAKNMIYYYFGNKEGLFVAVLERTYEQVRASQRDLDVRAHEPVEALRQLVRHTFIAFGDHPEAVRLFNEENLHKGRHIRRSSRVHGLYEPLLSTIGDVLDRGCAAGVFRRGLEPTNVYLAVSALCFHYLSSQHTLSVALGLEMASEASRQAWLDQVTQIILAYCSPVEAIPGPVADAVRVDAVRSGPPIRSTAP